MFRAALKRAPYARPMTSARVESSFHSSTPARNKKCNPKEWRIAPTAPGDCEFVFMNMVDQTHTFYTPEGMTAAEIMQIPRARKYLWDEETAKFYIKLRAEKKKRARENGIFQD
ncbi:hypothetical protein BKA70DRAFT_1431571 [Coprinopsis sp. MPI-PUGE-AT-0042]|nr:hypothetical protein BKA70DRAFT_1431571 [Coprinopsis sp. MPI-PUGE-AT-0042]